MPVPPPKIEAINNAATFGSGDFNVRMCLLLCFNIVFSAVGVADEHLPMLADKVGAIVDKYGVSRTASVHLGALPKNTRGKLSITLRNDTGEKLGIDRVKSSCGCLSPTITVDSIAPGATARLQFVLETPKQAVQREISVTAILIATGGRDVRLNMRYVIEGVLATPSPVSVIEVSGSEEFQRFTIPLVYTEPVTPDQIQLTADAQLEPVSFKIGVKDDQASIIGEFPLEELGDDGFSGRVFVEHPQTHQRVPVDLIIRRSLPVTVSPSIITMRRKSKDDETFLGPAIVHVRHNGEVDTEDTALIDVGQTTPPVQVRSKRLGSGVYRLTVTSSPSSQWLRDNRSTPIEVRFQIRTRGELCEISRKLRFIE